MAPISDTLRQLAEQAATATDEQGNYLYQFSDAVHAVLFLASDPEAQVPISELQQIPNLFAAARAAHQERMAQASGQAGGR